MSKMKLTKTGITFLLLLFIFFALGSLLNYLYTVSPRNVINKQHFQSVIHNKEIKANEVIDVIEKNIKKGYPVDSLSPSLFKDKEIIYYIFHNNRLVFWSDNQIAPNNDYEFSSDFTSYVKMPNNHCIYTSSKFDSYRIVALIIVKYAYSSESDMLKNHFVSDFRTSKNVVVTKGNNSDLITIRSVGGNYLFSLSTPSAPIYNSYLLLGAHVAFLFAFVFFFLFYALSPKLLRLEKISLQTFLSLAFISGIAITFFLLYDIPKGYFISSTSMPQSYQANSILKSLGHLTIYTFYFVANIYLFNSVNIKPASKKKTHIQILSQFVFFIFFLLFYSLLLEIVFHSKEEISILSFSDFDILHIWMHFLIVLWGLGFILLFFKTYSWIKRPRDYFLAIITNLVFTLCLYVFSFIFAPRFAGLVCISFLALVTAFLITLKYYKRVHFFSNYVNGIYIFALTAIITFNVYVFEDFSRNEKFKTFAEKMSSDSSEDEQMINMHFSQLDSKLKQDKTIQKLVTNTGSILQAEAYLNQTYLSSLWTDFNISISVYEMNSSYVDLIKKYSSHIGNTNFYKLSAQSENSYYGVFDIPSDSISFIINLEPNRVYRSYSFPNLLISYKDGEQIQFNIATATYETNNLISSSGRYNYPTNSNWLPNDEHEWTSFLSNNVKHYVLNINDKSVKIVVTDLKNHSPRVYSIYFIYSFLVYFVLFWLYILTIAIIYNKRPKINLISRFQYLFFTLFLFSFVAVFFVSSDFLKQKYQNQQIASIEEKRMYVQKILQEKYYWNLTLTPNMAKTMSADLQDLSYTFQTDIHVYDNNGVLISSSQPIIFNRNLISRRISPQVYFLNDIKTNKYESIGNLNYLNSYSEFYNGDYLQIGYIAIPQYYSQVDVLTETQEFLKFIIHIYVIAFIISLILSNVIRRKLSAPLENLEKKLKEMRIGQRNEKIDYKSNDEISQLVRQYNATVDELERSARLLAKSERESAWKLMARQIAHEINNPLTPMKLSIQQLQRMKKAGGEQFDEYFDKSTKILIEQIDNLSRIASTFSNFAKMPEAKFEETNITEKLYSVVELFKNNNEKVQIKYNHPNKNLFVFADPEQLVQVFNNLLKNAIQAIPLKRNKQIVVTLKVEYKNVVIDFTDNGMGIDPEIKDKLFVPSFTTKSTGTGLGLAISKNIVDTTGGSITFTSEVGVGTTFTVTIPLLG